MKKYFAFFLIILSITCAKGQQINIDNLKNELSKTIDDTGKLKILFSLSSYYSANDPDSTSFFCKQAIQISQKLKDYYTLSISYTILAQAYGGNGDYINALDMMLNALKTTELLKSGKEEMLAEVYNRLGSLNRVMKRYPEAISNYQKGLYYFNKAGGNSISNTYSVINTSIGIVYLRENKLDSAFKYVSIDYENMLTIHVEHKNYVITVMADVYKDLGKIELAMKLYRQAINNSIKSNNKSFEARQLNGLADAYYRVNNLDSSLYCSKKALLLAQAVRNPEYVQQITATISKAYDKLGMSDSALKYMKLTTAMNDSMYSKINQQFTAMLFNEEKRRQLLQASKEQYQFRIKLYISLAGALFFLIAGLILYRNNRQKQKANKVLQEQKDKVESTLYELKSTQSQLIQSEKMASLGELTAGIAHEIQNPLNFVNNFSDVNAELIDEMQTELQAGNNSQAIAISNDIKSNQEKITHHGKRAGDIVKGMLQHSRSSSATKEPTDINKLADEYLRLAYHGLRAKDKSFNATMKTDYDETIGNINIIPQDIGRVILNLITNAFYTVNEKAKSDYDNYEPIVTVTTKRPGSTLGSQAERREGTEFGGSIEIRVADNGNGIPPKILDKIFQPFFTTKPTGQGTGLGLSLSYDIVKAHGGELKVETNEGKGSEFIIQLPNHL